MWPSNLISKSTLPSSCIAFRTSSYPAARPQKQSERANQRCGGDQCADQLQKPIWVNLDRNGLVAVLQQNPEASAVCSFNLVLKPWECSLSKWKILKDIQKFKGSKIINSAGCIIHCACFERRLNIAWEHVLWHGANYFPIWPKSMTASSKSDKLKWKKTIHPACWGAQPGVPSPSTVCTMLPMPYSEYAVNHYAGATSTALVLHCYTGLRPHLRWKRWVLACPHESNEEESNWQFV